MRFFTKSFMRDPHVVSLTYKLLVPADLIYRDVPVTLVVQALFHGYLDNGILTVTMDVHFATVQEARAPVDAYLNGWKIDAHLGGYKIDFVFEDSEVIDRNPDLNAPRLIYGSAIMSSTSTLSASITIQPREYPPAPQWNGCSDLVLRMYRRFANYQEHRESIYSAGYYCSTALTLAADGTIARGGRSAAAEKFKVSLEVQKKLGELTSERGNPEFARKAGTSEPTPAEAAWLALAIPKLIRHVAAIEADSSVPELTMSDLPPL
jgi:hypothetical protein